jgi:hypothetical protein
MIEIFILLSYLMEMVSICWIQENKKDHLMSISSAKLPRLL